MRARSLVPIAAVVLTVAGAAGVARAQPSSSAPSIAAAAADEAYARHMDNGVRLYRSGDLEGALVEFRAAYDARPGPSPLVNEALCHRDRFRYPQAIAALERALAAHGAAMSGAERAQIDDALRELRGLLAFLRIEVDPPDAAVSIDGEDVPAERLRGPVPVGPGRHRVAARANGRVPQEERIEIASGEQRTLTFALPAATGTVRITAASPTTPIAIDGDVVGRGSFTGTLRAGRHEVRLVGEGTAIAIDVAPGEALDVRGGDDRGVRPLPAPPPPPPPPIARADRGATGPYATLGGSLVLPTSAPARPIDAGSGLVALVALRGGLRVAPFASFEILGAAAAGSGAADDGRGSWSRTSARGGVAFRASTTGRPVRLTAAIGGGVGWDEVDVDGVAPGDAGAAATGVDPFGIVDVGVEVETSRVLLGVAVEAWIDGVAGITDDAGRAAWDGPVVPAIGPSLRAGYAFW